ncbi:general stress protein [Peribacillus sp. FSL K6-1552]|uniref:general stress protein n=1 Tax=Peribacillus sp. FSL K6-1552 TaxID=2954514 RepID=UPI0030FA6465
MGITLYGVFDSNPEVIKEIQTLKVKGVRDEEITVIADKKEDLNFGNEKQESDVDVITNSYKDSFIEKVKHFFLNEGSGDMRSRLGDMGLADSETTAYINEVQAGKSLILLDESETISPEEEVTTDTLQKADRLTAENPLKTGMVNNPDPNLFPETTANAYQTREVEAQPGKSEELHVNSANLFENQYLNTNRAEEREIKANSTEKYKVKKPGDYEGTLASDPNVDPFSADTKKALDTAGALDRTMNPNVESVQQEEKDIMQDEYIKNRINTDNL